MNEPENWMRCRVCGQPTRFCHLNAQLCRPCGAFFKRAMTQQLHYRCRGQGNCELTNSLRNTCPACRFQRCRNAAAKVDDVGSSKKKLEVGLQLSSRLPDPQLNVLSLPRLWTMVCGYDAFVAEQGLLVKKTWPEVNVYQTKVFRPSLQIRVEIEKKCVALLLKIFTNYFTPLFHRLSLDQKIEITAESCAPFTFLHRTHLTNEVYRSLDDRRILINSCYYTTMDADNVFPFLSQFNENIEQFSSLLLPILEKRLKILRKYKMNQFGKEDTVVLMVLAVCEKLEFAGWLSDELCYFREQILLELTAQLQADLGQTEGLKHFGRLMDYHLECSHFNHRFQQAITFLKLSQWTKQPLNRPDIRTYLREVVKQSNNMIEVE
ncbi:hypothetical protein M3Y95_01270300 [Aphelenchoides besseyi]|nr:hypothetical protein M3Y95_01270300 [Aphelenchoides besseyi]